MSRRSRSSDLLEQQVLSALTLSWRLQASWPSQQTDGIARILDAMVPDQGSSTEGWAKPCVRRWQGPLTRARADLICLAHVLDEFDEQGHSKRQWQRIVETKQAMYKLCAELEAMVSAVAPAPPVVRIPIPAAVAPKTRPPAIAVSGEIYS